MSKEKAKVGKKFDKALYKAHDLKAKQVAIALFKDQFGVDLVDNPNKFGVDLISKDGKYRVEVEVKLGWFKRGYMWKDLRYSSRKWKFLQGDLANTYFITVNGAFNQLFLVPGQVVKDSPVVEVENKYSNGKLESFYSVNPQNPKVESFEFDWNE